MGSPAICRIDFNVNDRSAPVKAFIDRIGQVTDVPADRDCAIDLTRCQYLGPDAAALLAAVILDFRRVGRVLQIIPPEGPRELRSFFRVSQLERLAQGSELDGVRDESCPVLPLVQFQRASFQDADSIIGMLRRHSTLQPDTEEYLRICVNEVIQNIQDHAESPVGGLMTARFMETTKQVRVAIVDRGVGICTTLGRKFRDTTTENVMRRVLGGHYSAGSRENNLGLGLSNLAAIITQLGGELFILSEISAAEIRKGGWRNFQNLSARFQGTGVFFMLPVEK